MSRPIEEFKRTAESVAAIANAQLVGDSATIITGLTLSSKEVQEGDLFIALPGEKSHGADFAAEAISLGAVAVLTDVVGAAKIKDVPVIISSNPRRAAGVISAWFYSEPMRDLYSVGVTGTNGKTTVTTLLHQIMSAAGRESGLIGTVETRIGDEVIASKRTTPESSDLQALSAVMRERHMRNLVMEVSSHAIVLERVRGSHFAVVAFTNLSQDHLDFHKTMQAYFEAKARRQSGAALRALLSLGAKDVAVLREPARHRGVAPEGGHADRDGGEQVHAGHLVALRRQREGGRAALGHAQRFQVFGPFFRRQRHQFGFDLRRHHHYFAPAVPLGQFLQQEQRQYQTQQNWFYQRYQNLC